MTPGMALGLTPGLLYGFFDDAAVFPPGNLPLPQAVTQHRQHLTSSHAELVGPFVVAGAGLGELAGLLETGDPLAIHVTTDRGEIATALARLDEVPKVRLVALEVRLDAQDEPERVVGELESFIERATIYLELPRDGRRAALLAAMAGTGLRAKLRTGGMQASDFPSSTELATAVVAVVESGLGFKATAGLHHALPTPERQLGVTQHGFLNLLLAVGAARAGAPVDTVRGWLEAQHAEVVPAVRELDVEVRDSFDSFGTCSIADPLADLVRLGLWSPDSGAGG